MQLLVGIAGPMSGPRSAYGAMIRQIVTERPRPFGYLFGDDQADPVVAKEVAEGFVSQGVSVVIGHFNSECARRAGQVYRACGIPLFLPASTAQDLCLPGGIYRLCASEVAQITAMAHWLTGSGFADGAFWHDGSAYGIGLATAACARMDLAPVGECDTEAVGFPVFLFGNHRRVVEALNQLYDQGHRGPFIACDDCTIPEFAELIGTDCHQRTFLAFPEPAFSEALEAGLTLIGTLDPNCELHSQIRAKGGFVDGEQPATVFHVRRLGLPVAVTEA